MEQQVIKYLLVGFAAVALAGCGGGDDGPSDYWQGQIQVNGGAVLYKCSAQFLTGDACKAASQEAACRAAYPGGRVPDNASYVCVHTVIN